VNTVCPLPATAQEANFACALERARIEELAMERLGSGGRSVRLLPDYVRWKGPDGAIVGWHAEVGDEGGASYVTVRTAPPARLADEARKLSHRAEEETDEWSRSLALVEEHGLLLVGFPLDRQMSDLRRLVRPSKVRTLMMDHRPDLVPESLRISKSRSRRAIVRYKPERRAVLRWILGFKGADAAAADFDLTLWFRLLAEPLPFRAAFASAAMAAGVRVPELLAQPHDRLLVEGHLQGGPWRPDDAAALDVVAAALARLHRAEAPAGAPVRDAAAEVELGAQAARDLALLDPQLGASAHELAQRLAKARPAAAAMAVLHGDFHCGQVLLADDAGLCDFDRACVGPVAADLASLHAHAVAEDPQRGADFARRFVAAYGAGAELPDREALGFWNSAALLRMAATPFRGLHADWPGECRALLGAAIAAATEAGL
jgi:hypothetical protein